MSAVSTLAAATREHRVYRIEPVHGSDVVATAVFADTASPRPTG